MFTVLILIGLIFMFAGSLLVVSGIYQPVPSDPSGYRSAVIFAMGLAIIYLAFHYASSLPSLAGIFGHVR